MNEYITYFLKNLGCSHCQEFDFHDNSNKENLKNWKLYLKEYEMFSSMLLYNEKLDKYISYIINKNDSIYLLDNKNDIFFKLEYISDNEEDNSPILVPTEEYVTLYEKIEQMEKIFDKKLNALYIGTYNIKKCKN
jgi:hypothetical protein